MESPFCMHKSTALLVGKLILTMPVAYALLYPLLHPPVRGGVFKELALLGPWGSLAVAALFLCLVVLYCRDLARALSLVQASARAATPRSVWLMLVIPYNFVEDFFIVANVARSLRQEAQSNPALHGLRDFGMLSGLAWCSAQIASLLPNEIGSLAGVVALPFWIVHWRCIRRVNRLLAAPALNAQASGAAHPIDRPL